MFARGHAANHFSGRTVAVTACDLRHSRWRSPAGRRGLEAEYAAGRLSVPADRSSADAVHVAATSVVLRTSLAAGCLGQVVLQHADDQRLLHRRRHPHRSHRALPRRSKTVARDSNMRPVVTMITGAVSGTATIRDHGGSPVLIEAGDADGRCRHVHPDYGAWPTSVSPCRGGPHRRHPRASCRARPLGQLTAGSARHRRTDIAAPTLNSVPNGSVMFATRA